MFDDPRIAAAICALMVFSAYGAMFAGHYWLSAMFWLVAVLALHDAWRNR